MKNKIFPRLILVCALFFFSQSFFYSVSAIEYGMLGAKPANPDPSDQRTSSWFIYNLNPGEKKEDALFTMNLYEQPLEVLIYAADGVKSSGGGFAARQFSESKEEVGAWVRFYPDDIPSVFKGVFAKKNSSILEICALNREDLEAEARVKFFEDEFASLEEWCKGKDNVELEMKTKEQTKIPFIFSVPEVTEVGEHTGGIFIQKKQTEDAATKEGSAVKLTTRVGVRIYETVPGEIIKNLQLENFQVIKNFKEVDFSGWFKVDAKPEEYLVRTKIINDGNVSTDFKHIIRVEDNFFGKRNQEIGDRDFQVLKKDTFVSNYAWNNPRFGKFTFTSKIIYVDKDGLEKTISSAPIIVWIFPWREVITVFVIILMSVFVSAAWLYRRKKLYGGVEWVNYEVKDGDNLNQIAEKFKVDWETLAKTNKLKAPYLLNPKQIILVPPIIEETVEIEMEAQESFESEKREIAQEENFDKESQADKEQEVFSGEDPGKKKKVAKKVSRGRKKKNSLAAETKKVMVEEEINLEKDLQDKVLKKDGDKKKGKIVGEEDEKEEEVIKKIIGGSVAERAIGEIEKESHWLRWFVGVMLVMIFLIGAVFLWFKYYKNNSTENENTSISAMKNISSEEQSESFSEQGSQVETSALEDGEKEVSPDVQDESQNKYLDIKKVRVAILNGGGKPGSAGKLKEFLEIGGYKNVLADNADENDHKGQTIYYQIGGEKAAELLKEAVSKKYPDVSVKEAGNEEEKSADLVILIGI